jgi:ADP-ribosyl-[dinitrogen reductase] hydrolase
MNSQENAVGAVVGSAIGDALGAGYEFGPPVSPDAVSMVGGGPFQWEPGEWTDDTQMSVCVLTGLAQGADPRQADGALQIAQEFHDWFATRPKDIGNQTRSVLSSSPTASHLPRSAKEYTARNPDTAAGNGSLMRTSSITLRYLNDRSGCAAAARSVSELTHPDPLASDACVLWSEAIRLAITEGHCDLLGGIDLLPIERRASWNERIGEAQSHPPIYFSQAHGRANGYVVHALQCAWSSIHHATQRSLTGPQLFETAVRSCVSAGDDADTTAAICGGLVGAVAGVSAIPLRWIAQLHGWPGVGYDRLMRLSLQVVGKSTPTEDVSWAAKEKIPALKGAFRVALPSDPGVTLGNADTLDFVEPDVAVVSLCRIGTSQVRPRHHTQVWLSDSNRNRYAPEVLRHVAGLMHQWRQEGRSVFVHCAAGESRTPAAAAAYLTLHKTIDATDAYGEAHDAVGNIRRLDSPFSELFTGKAFGE